MPLSVRLNRYDDLELALEDGRVITIHVNTDGARIILDIDAPREIKISRKKDQNKEYRQWQKLRKKTIAIESTMN